MDSGLVLVVGPAGSGRTTLLSQLAGAAASAGTPVVELTVLDTGHLRWHGGERTEVHGLGTTVDLVCSATSPALVTIDDGDGLRGLPDHEYELVRLLDGMPDGAQVVLAVSATSWLPAETEERLVGVLPASELAFRPHEVDQLFREIYRTPLGSEDAHTLARVTQGWAAAIALFHAGTAAHLPGELSRAVRTLVHEPWFLADHAEQVLLAACTVEERAVLRWGSVFDRITPARLTAILGPGDYQAVLDQLDNLPSFPSISTETGLQLPEPLRRYLRAAHARTLGQHEAPKWFTAAAEVLESEGDVPGALLCHARGGDTSAVERLTRSLSVQLWNGARAREPWDVALTESTPRAMVFARLSRAVADGALTHAETLIDQLDERTDPRLAALRESLRAWGSARMTTAEPEREVEWRTRLRWALQGATLPPPSAHRPGDLFVSGIVHGLGSDLELARTQLRAVAEDPESGPGLVLLARVAVLLLDRALPVEQVLDGADRALTMALDAGLPWVERLAQTVVLGIEGAPSWRDAVGRLRRWGQEVGDLWGPIVVSTVSELCAARRDEDDSQRWLELAAAWGERGLPLVAEACRLVAARTSAWRELSSQPMEEWPDVVSLGSGPGAASEDALDGTGETRPAAETESPTAAPTTLPPGGWLPAAVAGERGVTVRCLGPFEIRRDGRVVDLGSLRPRARNLLRLLAIEAGHVVHRDRIVEALWSDLPAESATHNLHVSVSSVRRVLNEVEPGLGRRILQREGESYVLRLGEGATCDLIELETALRAGEYAASRDDDNRARQAWTRALAVYTDDLLPEVGPAEWVVGPRDRLRQQVAAVATALAALLLRSREPVAAAEAAARAIELDEWRDQAWRLLIAARTLTGERATAQRLRQSYQQMLRSLGVEETRAAPAPAPSGPVRDRAGLPASWGERLPGGGRPPVQ